MQKKLLQKSFVKSDYREKQFPEKEKDDIKRKTAKKEGVGLKLFIHLSNYKNVNADGVAVTPKLK